ncbi:MAG: ATP-binding cassette domain-containing protein [Bacteroidetes bacterium]|nr:ATP-binding cassette domain-containing protein [Bacteroidota bacterium]
MSEESRIVYPSFRRYWYLIVLTIALSLFSAIFEGFSIGLLIPFLQSLSPDTADTFRTGLEWVDRWLLAVHAPKLEQTYRICGLILVSTWLRSGLSYLASATAMKSRALVVEDLRMRIMDQLQAVSLLFFSKARSGEIINSLTNELTRVGHSLQIFFGVVTQGILMLVYVSFMVWISWQLTLIVVVFFSLLFIGLTRLVVLTRRSGEKVTEANARFTSQATELLGGIRTIRAFNTQAFEKERLQHSANQIASAVIESSRRALLFAPLTQAVVSTVLIAIVLIAVQQFILPGRLDIAYLLTFIFALFRLLPIVQQLNNQRGQWASQRASFTNVADLLRRSDKPYLKNGTKPLQSFTDELVFENVSFSYDPETPVLKRVDLCIKRGMMVALVGASGAGKSTLVDLIPRFHDPTEGRILLDGVDLRELDVRSLRQRIAVVSQDTFIFNDTVTNNIAYGLGTVSLEQVRNAAEQANALAFIEEMQDGFDAMLGDRGVRLSGGQRQRLAIARALLRDPDILILDEATSALDSVSERLVQQSLERLMQGRTVIAIAHRLSTVENADHLVVLEEGRIVEQGPYERLLALRKQLWKYHSIQYQSA